MASIGNEIKNIRIENQLTQEQFSQKIGVSRPFVSRIENGKEVPSKPIIKLIGLLFKEDVNWLFQA